MSGTLSRRELLGGLGLGALAAGCAGSREPRAAGPNVLMISIDDLNDWIGVLDGHPQTLTPNIDALAERGVTFRRAYCQTPACNPSRASLMTGRRPTTSGCYGNGDVWRDAMPLAVTLPQHFMQHGYEAIGGGKTFHQSQNEAASWHYYHSFRGFLWPPDYPLNQLDRGGFDWGSLDIDEEDTTDTQLANWAAEYLSRDHSGPFFLACGFYRPHLPFYAPKKYFDKFPEAEVELPPYLANDLDDVPESAPTERGLEDHELVTATGQWRRAVAAYLACINFADANVGRVLKALDEGPHAGNTVIVLWTDHGWQLGEKNQWRKYTLWERSCRVPIIFAGPGIEAEGEFCDRTAELLDIYPTLADLAGLPGREDLDGESLRPLLENPEAEWNHPAITSDAPDRSSIRTERWRYTTYREGEELYDHDSDPNEWRNLASLPEHADTKQRLRALLPRNPSRKKVLQVSDQPEEERRLTELLPGRSHRAGAANDVGLDPAPY
ncbi:MAG: sulfatase [Acidobacteriota bacterium]|nr:sulfatase [Acidobacteriota bacterium]